MATVTSESYFQFFILFFIFSKNDNNINTSLKNGTQSDENAHKIELPNLPSQVGFEIDPWLDQTQTQKAE